MNKFAGRGRRTMRTLQHAGFRDASPAMGADDEVLLTAKQVCARLGGVSTMTLWRWLGSDVVRFPQPTLRINKRRYWSAGCLRRWLAERGSEPIAV